MTKLGAPLLLLLIAVSALGPLALNGVLPATTVIIEELSTRYSLAQLVLTVFLIANLLSQIVMGIAADQYGRRPVMLVALLIFVLGSFCCALAPSIEFLLTGRFIQGVGGAVCVFLPRTIVRDIHTQDRSASVIGYMTTAMMVAPLFGPAVGGWITDTYSWRNMYSLLGMLGSVMWVAAYFMQPETLRQQLIAKSGIQPKQPFFQSAKELLANRAFLACTCMQAGTVGVYYSFLSGAPYVAMESFGLSASAYGLWFIVVAIGYLSGNLTAGKFSEAHGVRRMITVGFVPYSIGVCSFWLVLIPSFDHPGALFLPMMLVAFSNGMALPSMVSLAMSTRPEYAATASGLAGSIQLGVGVVFSVALGFLLPHSDSWLMVLISLSALLAFSGFSHSRKCWHLS